MNSKHFLYSAIVAFIISFGIDYFFWGRRSFKGEDADSTSQQFKAPQHKRELKPLNCEIDFIDTKRTAEAELYSVETDLATYTFSTDGGTLEGLTFKRNQDGNKIELTTIAPQSETEREKGCFLIALNEKTPFFYTMREAIEQEDRVTLEYKADTHDASIVKKFTIYKQSHRIDLALTVNPKKSAVEPRIIFPSPLMKEIGEQDKYAAITTNERGAVTVEKNLTKLQDAGWFEPSLLGSADKYFVHAMINDESHFAERGYFNQVGSDRIITFIEGPTVSEETTWYLSFYFGPKVEEAMRPIDPRLEKTLDYAGWLTPISQALLKLMKLLHDYLRNYGLVIIAVTALLKLVLLPFTIKGDKKAKEHAEFQRKMAYIQKRYKNDKEMLQKEQAALIEKHGLPGLAGCLPMFIQLPIFFALNPILNSSLDLYQAPFLWIPDLSARDPYFILPICIVLCMVTQALTLEKQGRMPALAVALVIAAVSINFSAGLSLYIFISALLGLLQSALQKRIS